MIIQYLPTSHLTELVAGILLAVGELHGPEALARQTSQSPSGIGRVRVHGGG